MKTKLEQKSVKALDRVIKNNVAKNIWSKFYLTNIENWLTSYPADSEQKVRLKFDNILKQVCRSFHIYLRQFWKIFQRYFDNLFLKLIEIILLINWNKDIDFTISFFFFFYFNVTNVRNLLS